MRALLLIGAAALSLAACNRDDDAEQAAAGACAALTAEQFASRGLDLGSGSTMNGVGVRRERGSSRCSVQDGGVGCEMTDPGVVGVAPTEGAPPAYFDVPQGRSASITVNGGAVRCTLS